MQTNTKKKKLINLLKSIFFSYGDIFWLSIKTNIVLNFYVMILTFHTISLVVMISKLLQQYYKSYDVITKSTSILATFSLFLKFFFDLSKTYQAQNYFYTIT